MTYYQSLEHKIIQDNQMTNLESIYPEPLLGKVAAKVNPEPLLGKVAAKVNLEPLLERPTKDNNQLLIQQKQHIKQQTRPKYSNIPNFSCLHCGKDLTQNEKRTTEMGNGRKRPMVLNRGIYADYLEPEYHRYNKTLQQEDYMNDLGGKYMMYKPRRPKCPIKWNKLVPVPPKSHLINNPLYTYPISNNIKQLDQKFQDDMLRNDKQFTQNILDFMEEYDNAEIV